MIFVYIICGLILILFLLFSIIHLTYIPEEKALKKAKEEAFQKKIADYDALVAKLQKKEDDIKKKNDIIDHLRIELSDLRYFQKMKDRMDSDKKRYDSIMQRNNELMDENSELKAENFDLELKLSDKESLIKSLFDDDGHLTIFGYSADYITHLIEQSDILDNEEAYLDHKAISLIRYETWKDLKGKRYRTLTSFQQSQIHFPLLDPTRVYYLPSHPSFHSVYWCYTLDNSPTPDKTTLEAAIQQKLKPCSKCVDPQLYEDYVNQQQLQKPSP